MSRSAAEFRERWRGPKGEDRAAHALAALAAGESPENAAFGTIAGRLDLRGLPGRVPAAVARGVLGGLFMEQLTSELRLADSEIRDLDLSFASLDHLRLADVRLSGCSFEGARLRDLRVWTSEVSDCSFVEADLRDSALGTRLERGGVSWRRVDFKGANMRSSFFTGAALDEVSFREAKLDGVEFRDCVMHETRFAGALSKVLFDFRGRDVAEPSPTLGNADFAACSFDEVDFRGCQFDAVSLPASPDIIVIPDARIRLTEALHGVDANGTARERSFARIVGFALKAPRDQRIDFFINLADFGEESELTAHGLFRGLVGPQ